MKYYLCQGELDSQGLVIVRELGEPTTSNPAGDRGWWIEHPTNKRAFFHAVKDVHKTPEAALEARQRFHRERANEHYKKARGWTAKGDAETAKHTRLQGTSLVVKK